MQIPQPISDFVRWRWAPCVGLTAGSLTFVALAVLIIPAQFEEAPGSSQVRSSFGQPGLPAKRAIFGASLTREAGNLARQPSDDAPSRAQPTPVAPPSDPGMQRHGFSPVAEREPAQPAVGPTESPPPPTNADGVILQQPDGPGGPSREEPNQ